MGNLAQPSRLKSSLPQRRKQGKASAARPKAARNPFWAWFAETIAPLGAAGLDDDGIVARIDAEFSKHYPDLAFELWGPDGDMVDFVISADGQTPLFDAVLDAVRGAPRTASSTASNSGVWPSALITKSTMSPSGPHSSKARSG